MHKPILALSAGLMLAFVQQSSAQVTIEIVNDSGRPDTNVFIKIPGLFATNYAGIGITPTNLFVATLATSTNVADATSVALSTLATNNAAAPYLTTSPISGNTNTVYTIQADFISSGTIYFSYDKPFVFTNGVQPSPPPDSTGNALRYDYGELTINNSNAPYNAIDITYVDKFGIPLQMEWFRGTNLMSGSYVYLSTKSLVSVFTNTGLAQAVFSLNPSNITAGWQYTGPASYTNFARILAPQKVSGTTTSVSPYPVITNYLNSVVGNSFWLNGAAPQGGWYYEGYIASLSTTAGGWLLTLAKGPTTPPFNPTLITGGNYTNTITVPISNTNASQYVYGAPVGPNQYSVNGTLVTDSTSGTYSVEVWMIGDALSALNFGFWNGNYGTNSADWFSPVEWTSFPFAAARPTNDGYYNQYAGLIYYYSDPYSFAFSERITPDVLMGPVNGDRIRITVLPDDRLDSPIVLTPSSGNITSNSISLDWVPSAGATSYQLNVLRPTGIAPISIPASSTNYTLTNLQPGSPYFMSLQAKGTGANGNAIISPARTFSATTAGSLVPASGDLTAVFTTFNVSDPFYQIQKVYLNGTLVTLYTNGQWFDPTTTNYARWNASAGTNQVTVKVVGTNDQVFFNDWLSFTLTTNAGNTATASAAHLGGQKLSQPAPGFNNTTFNISTQNVNLQVSLTFVPAEKRVSPPASLTPPAPPIPAPPAAGVTITNIAGIPGGGIRFSFNVPQGTNYAIIASTNVASGTWYTNATGVGAAGLTSYTNAAGSNAMQFYRVKY